MKISLLDPEFLADPYPGYAWLRANDPVRFLGDGMWAVARHEHVAQVLRDPAVFSSQLGYGPVLRGQGPRLPGASDRTSRSLTDTGLGVLLQSFTGLRVLISSDPPDHTRLRRLVSKPFAPRKIAALEPRIRQICDSLVDEMLQARVGGVADLWAHVSYPLPTMVIAEILGIPPEQRADFKRWSDAIVNGLSLGGTGQVDEGVAGVLEMFHYFADIIADRRADPKDDLVSELVHASDGSDEPLTTEELIAFAVLLLVAGNETTTNLLGNFVEAMHAHPDQLRRLRDDPALVPAAVEEVLRYDSPVQGLWRGLRSATELGGKELPAGDRVMVLFASANRDEARFGDDADTFRLDRRPVDAIPFGVGIHFCLGASLARTEARVAIESVLERTSAFERAAEPVRPLSPVLRGVRSQPLHLVAA